jgi:hypothetical protein
LRYRKIAYRRFTGGITSARDSLLSERVFRQDHRNDPSRIDRAAATAPGTGRTA